MVSQQCNVPAIERACMRCHSASPQQKQKFRAEVCFLRLQGPARAVSELRKALREGLQRTLPLRL